MKPLDGRKVGHATLEALRLRAVRRVEAGDSSAVVIASLGMSRLRIYEWLAAYRAGGVDELRAKPVPSRRAKSTDAQLRNVYRIITSKNTLLLKFPFALCTRGRARQLIREKFNVELSESSVGRMLRKLGLRPQKPLRRAYQQYPGAVGHWKKHKFPKIQRRMKQRGAMILFADEARVQSDFHSGRTLAPVGETPSVESTGARFGIALIAAVSPRGESPLMGVGALLNADEAVDFMIGYVR